MKTLYLLCGLLCDEVVWEAQARALRSRYDVRIVSFLQQDSIEAMAAHVLSNAPDSFCLAGHSMGGRVALEVYRQAPQRIERLALLDTGYEGVVAGEAEKRAVLVNQALAEGIGSIATVWGLPMLSPSHRNDAVLVQTVIDMVERMSGEIYAAQTRALLTRSDATSVLNSISCATMILCGMQDGWSPPARHEQMAKFVSHCILRLIDDCGHMAMMEQPDIILSAIEEWMALPAVAYAG